MGKQLTGAPCAAKGQEYDDEVARVRRLGQRLLAMNLAAEEKARSTVS